MNEIRGIKINKESKIKILYLFITGIIFYAFVWFAQVTDIPFVSFTNVVSVVLLLLLFVVEWLYVIWLGGNWKVFITFEPLFVFICLDPMFLYQNTFLGKNIRKIIMILFNINSLYSYKCCQKNISFCCGIVLVIYLILSVSPFMAIEKEIK